MTSSEHVFKIIFIFRFPMLLHFQIICCIKREQASASQLVLFDNSGAVVRLSNWLDTSSSLFVGTSSCCCCCHTLDISDDMWHVSEASATPVFFSAGCRYNSICKCLTNVMERFLKLHSIGLLWADIFPSILVLRFPYCYNSSILLRWGFVPVRITVLISPDSDR